MSGPVRIKDVPAESLTAADVERPTVEVTDSRVAEVGGHKVLRALPQARRRTVGPWCFVDHLTPTTLAMEVGPHPHIGLQTVTWLLEGEAVHYDSIGSEQLIRPGQLNLMSAGHGVAHAEETPSTYSGGMHGVQLWLAQPESTRNAEPAFEHHDELPIIDLAHGSATVLVGSLLDVASPARQDTPTFGADISLNGIAELPLNTAHEYAAVCLDGVASINGHAIHPGQPAYLGQGADAVHLSTDAPARVLLIGGEPFESRIFMWWNFVARNKDEATAAFQNWQEHAARFGTVASHLPRIDSPIPPWMPSGSNGE